jgi:hypothetical protein
VDLRLSPSRSSGGFGFHRDLDQHRDHWQVALTTDEGPHAIEGGVDLERVVSVANSRHGGGGQQIHIFRSGGVDFYRHRYYVDDLAPDFDPANQATWRLLDPFASRAFDYNTALYVQDRFRAAPNLTIDAGLRWERQDLYGRGSRKVVSLSGNWALRLGAVFDPTNEGRTRIIGYYGRYFESVPMDINLRSFGRELTCFCYNFSADPDDLAPVGGPPRFSSLLSSAEEVDAPLRGQYLDEYVAAIEHRMAPSIVVAARFNQRRIGRVIEDIITPSDEYVVVNPSEGNVGSRLTFFDYDTAPAPPPRRTNTSLELSGIKHFSDGWQVLASYVVSRLSGNYDGTFQAATGQLDPNITLAYDFGDFLINADGPLTTDRRHQFKLDGSYSWSEGLVSELTAGLSVRYLSGTPRTAYGYSFIYQSWEYFLTPRGSLGRNPAYWEADLHADYPVRVGGQSIQVTVDVFNLFNRQAITVYDQRYNLSSQGPCGGVPFSICNGDNGLQHEGATFAPLSQLADPLATAPNPDFLSAGHQFTSPLSVRIGARLRF